MFYPILFSIAGFLSGGVLYSYHVPKLLCGVDVVADSPDHNPGMTNAMKLCGVPVGLLCLALDMAALTAGLDGLGLSRRRLTELFRQTYGTTPGACLTALRLSEACRLLRQTDLSVAHVAGEAGFESLSAFYRAFRRELGCSPGTYRTKEMSS